MAVLFDEADTIFAQSVERTTFFTKGRDKCLIIFVVDRVPRHVDSPTLFRKVGLTSIKITVVSLTWWYFLSQIPNIF